MDMDELLPPKKTAGALAELLREDLDRLSREEVTLRIATLEAEIARCKARLESATALRSAADELFRK
jgi:uncharacterized small protein (DUF1192 family)